VAEERRRLTWLAVGLLLCLAFLNGLTFYRLHWLQLVGLAWFAWLCVQVARVPVATQVKPASQAHEEPEEAQKAA
jgi:hypothetical protein